MGGAPPKQQAPSKKPVDPLTAQTNTLRVTAFNNMAMVYIKTKQWQKAREKCDSVIAKDKENTKALIRRAMALRHLGSLERARTDLEAAQKLLAPKKDMAIVRELKLLKKEEKKAENALYKEMQRRMQGKRKTKKKAEKTAPATETKEENKEEKQL